ncbi:metallophosphoesterase [Herpetosiphon sp. NSE202]|uniref:metallophosphoesterase n=1 Tax=Herpetosiphon sp. NSE202 TaxID=3351349 RepID=UPI00362D7AE0
MRIWAIADLHLAGGQDKPMDVFGAHWRNHAATIAKAWHECVATDDLVLIAGDISWAMHLNDVRADLAWIDSLPGKKVLCKGNHDYWWSSKNKVRAILPASLQIVDCDAVIVDEIVVCGTRGWAVPGDRDFDKTTDQRIYERELGRLERALAGAQVLAEDVRPIYVLLHFPPFRDGQPTEFAKRIAAANAHACVYGHLHQAEQWANATTGHVESVFYQLTACDALGFTPILLNPNP